MGTVLRPEDRLIVAADFELGEAESVEDIRKKVLDLGNTLKGLGVCIKVNSILRADGYHLIDLLHNLGLKVCADLKLIDIPNTMRNDGKLLALFTPDLLTVMCCAGVAGMKTVQDNITNVLGVTILTSHDERECQRIYGCSPDEGVIRFALMAQEAGVSGLILSPQEAQLVRENGITSLTLNTPGIRPSWSIIEGDDQARVTTPAQAIAAGADRIVIGRPITGAKPNDQGFPQNPREAVLRTLEEIASV